jgi:arsenate reductase (thioredoxin)
MRPKNAVNYFFEYINRNITLIESMSESKSRVLFVCIHNSARSQMAEAFLKRYGGDAYDVQSAGLEPGSMNPNVIRVMAESGIDLSKKTTQGVFDLYNRKTAFDTVITVCDGASAEKCPVFPGGGKRIAWSFEDPSSFKGSEEEILQRTRKVRDEIEKSVLKFIKEEKI